MKRKVLKFLAEAMDATEIALGVCQEKIWNHIGQDMLCFRCGFEGEPTMGFTELGNPLCPNCDKENK